MALSLGCRDNESRENEFCLLPYAGLFRSGSSGHYARTGPSAEVLPLVWEHLEAVKQGSIARTADVPFRHKDGSVLYAECVSSPICYRGRPGWISFFHDVTERKQAQDALQREHRTLKHLLQSSDHERQTIAYEIHDGLAQYLAGAIMQFDVYKSHQRKNQMRRRRLTMRQ